MSITNWKTLISKAFAKTGDDWEHVEACTLTELELATPFDHLSGAAEGRPFTLWTATRVYFPVVFDGQEWVGSVPRHPNGEATEHQGGQ